MSKVSKALLIDITKCVGCMQCSAACKEGHKQPGDPEPTLSATAFTAVEPRGEKFVRRMCLHCEDPSCASVCPVGGITKTAQGAVRYDGSKCIGCRYCMLACPYKARSFIHEDVTDQKPWSPRGKGTVESCNLCVHRIDEGKGRIPACAEACEREGHRAILFGDLNDPASDIAKARAEQESRELRADLGLNTGVRYQNL